MLIVVPVAAIPAVLAARMLEGWTRPEEQGQGGIAHPRIRRWALHGLVALTMAFTTFAAIRWPR